MTSTPDSDAPEVPKIYEVPEAAEAPDRTRDALTRWSRGDRAALDDLLQRHLPALRVFVRLQIGETLRLRESCSDLVQSTCRELLEDLDASDGGGFEYRGEAAFRGWLCAAALNKIRQRLRYHEAERRDPAREVRGAVDVDELYRTALSPSRTASARESIKRLEAVFDKLPEHYREVILLCRVVGLGHEEAAERMGRTVDSVRNLLFRALARVAGLADEAGGAAPG